MPIHNKIIHRVNLCLKQKCNVNLKLTKSEIYARLADLYENYSLENKSDLFFDAFAQLCDLPDDYQFGDNLTLDSFIIQYENEFIN